MSPLWFGPCLKRVVLSTSRHRDYDDLVRVSCLQSRRIKTYKAGEEEKAVPAAWVRDHLCGECRRRRSVVTTTSDQPYPPIEAA